MEPWKLITYKALVTEWLAIEDWRDAVADAMERPGFNPSADFDQDLIDSAERIKEIRRQLKNS